jgi:protoheme IX farnesyltransferase
MATDAIAGISAPSEVARGAQHPRGARAYTALAEYWALTKPEVNFLIAIATFAGFYLGRPTGSHDFPFLLAIHTLLGTLLVASGTGTLNQYVERCFDARMRRTARRPLAAGRMQPSSALWFGIALSVAGAVYLAVAANFLASGLAIVTLVSYLFLYTPLKRRTPFCTLVGAVPGAMPPLIGAAAAGGGLTLEAWILYLILFFWQFPHFMAIAWMYREDYDRAGYLVLPHGEPRARFVTLQTIVPLLALVAVSLLPMLLGKLGVIYYVGALILSLGFLYYGAQLVLRRSNAAARRLLATSIIYLPALFVLILLGRF